MPILQRQIAEFMQEYNAYSVRKQKDRLCPPGVPEDNFHFPERQGNNKSKFIGKNVILQVLNGEKTFRCLCV